MTVDGKDILIGYRFQRMRLQNIMSLFTVYLEQV